MSTIETYSFPLFSAKYSSSFQKKVEEVLIPLFSKNQLVNHPTIQLTGHKVVIADRTFWFEPGTKNVFLDGAPLTATVAKTVRGVVKQLSMHASDLGLLQKNVTRWQAAINKFHSILHLTKVEKADDACPIVEQQPAQETAGKIDVIASKTLTVLFPISDLIGVIRNLLDLIQVVGTMVQSPWFMQMVDIMGHQLSKSALIFGQCIAGFRIVQGCISLAVGVSRLYLAFRAYQRSIENHDAAGAALAKDQIKAAVINIATGLFWITLGIMVLSCPQTMIAVTTIGTVFILLQWTLFYGLFVTDSILGLKMTALNQQSIQKHYGYLVDDILNNKELSDEQVTAAIKRFLIRISTVSQIEREKTKETLHKKLGHQPLPSEIQTRIKQKRAKKCADLGRVLGLDLASLEKILNSSNPVDEIFKYFETSIAQQDASKCLAILCLAINAIGMPCDGFTLAHFLKIDHLSIVQKICNFLQMGLGTNACALIGDGGWVAVNAFYGTEDLQKMSLFTRLFKNLGPKLHQKSHWWTLTHPIRPSS